MIVNETGPNPRFEGTFAEILALDLNSVSRGSTFWATDLPRMFGVKQETENKRALYILDGKVRSLESDLNRKLARADDYAIGSTAVDEAGKRYVVRLGPEGNYAWVPQEPKVEPAPAKQESAKQEPALKISGRTILYGGLKELPKPSDLSIGTLFIRSDKLVAYEVQSFTSDSQGRFLTYPAWNECQCHFEGTVAEMLAMDAKRMPCSATFRTTDKRCFRVQFVLGQNRWCINDTKTRLGVHDFQVPSLPTADEYHPGSTVILRGNRYELFLDAAGESRWDSRPNQFLALPEPLTVGESIRINNELYVCSPDKRGKKAWFRSSGGEPLELPAAQAAAPVAQPLYDVYVLWSHHGWELVGQDLTEEQAEAKRVEKINHEFDEDHEQILAAEVFPQGQVPHALGVPKACES